MNLSNASPPPVKFFVASLLGDPLLGEPLVEKVREEIGDIDYLSPPFPFSHTGYYGEEMGGGLHRRFISLRKCRPPSFLVDLKLACAAMERGFAVDGRRRVNLDPGYVDSHKVVLASLKHGGWKIYLDRGVWADVTLHYRGGEFHSFEWTFPDFRDGRYGAALKHIRSLWKHPRRPPAVPPGTRPPRRR